ncbi:MAG: hypothetical protein Q9191_003520 [Dirinaria sp. TL-2023a]
MGSKNITFTVFKGSQFGSIVQSKTTRPPLVGDQVLVSITVSGLCGGDLIFRGNGIALGHEGVGVVAATGPAVRMLKTGDRVGWGFLQDTCGHCMQCLDGTETFCPERKMYGRADLDQGSLAYGIVKKEARLLRIPSELSDEEAAPLMYAGATVFNVLDTYGAKPTHRVGVAGIGGLGHLAIQFASKMGCDVVAFSGSEDKDADAHSFGARACYYSTQSLKDANPGPVLDLLLVTAPAQPDRSVFLPLLAPKAKIFPLTIGPGSVILPAMPLLLNGITIQGSVVASRNVSERMLAFAARRGVKPQVHKLVMDREGIEEAFALLKDGKMRYRGVLVVPEGKRLT